MGCQGPEDPPTLWLLDVGHAMGNCCRAWSTRSYRSAPHTAEWKRVVKDEWNAEDDAIQQVPQPLTPIYDEDGFALDH